MYKYLRKGGIKMKAIIKFSFISVLLILAVSCATTPRALPEKYNLDNDLEAVDKIYTFRAITWKEVDKQSIILTVDWKDYYLLVLDQPVYAMYFVDTLGIDSSSHTIRSGYDRVIVRDSTGTDYYVIDKIYKLKDWDQAEEIKKRLLNAGK
jgi:hypothetical protein